MKFLSLLFFLVFTQRSFAFLPEGTFLGAGTMSCNFLNGNIDRPNSLTWQIEKTSEEPLTYEMIGSLAIVNSAPIHFFATEVKERVFELKNESNEKRGRLKCSEANCDLIYTYLTNGFNEVRVPQTIEAKWNLNSPSKFFQVGKLYSIALPFVLDCKFNDVLLKDE